MVNLFDIINFYIEDITMRFGNDRTNMNSYGDSGMNGAGY